MKCIDMGSRSNLSLELFQGFKESQGERTIEKVVRENGVTLPRLISGQPGCRVSAKDVHILIFYVFF